MMESTPSKKFFNVILLGEPSVGIKSFYNKCTKYEDKSSKHPVLFGGEDWAIYHQNIEFDNKIISFNRWQTWEEIFDPFPFFYWGSDGALIFFDTTDKLSFMNTTRWIENVKKNSKRQVKFMMIGTKSDLINERVISYEEGKKLADELGMIYLEISSKLNMNIKITCMIIANLIMK